MMELHVQIVEFISDDPQPGIVACEFVGADGRLHKIVDKVLIFNRELLDANSTYPQPGSLRCRPMARWRDAAGREVVRIIVEWVESSEGLTEFVVLSSQLSPVEVRSDG